MLLGAGGKRASKGLGAHLAMAAEVPGGVKMGGVVAGDGRAAPGSPDTSIAPNWMSLPMC
jgi:hypothetical protein